MCAFVLKEKIKMQSNLCWKNILLQNHSTTENMKLYVNYFCCYYTAKRETNTQIEYIKTKSQ